MALPKRLQDNNSFSFHKSDDMKTIKDRLEQAKQELIEAQKAKKETRVKQLERIIENLSATVGRNA